MKAKRRAATLLITAAMLLSLSACGVKPQKVTTNAGDDAATTTEQT